MLRIKAALQIAKPAPAVFEAIVNPEKMSGYFIAESTGRMEPGCNLVWQFPEFDMQVPVRIGDIRPDEFISWYWGPAGAETRTEITLVPAPDDSTVVTITEGDKANDEAGLAWLVGNTEGWANFLACLKAYLEYGINLRKGGFDFRRDERKAVAGTDTH